MKAPNRTERGTIKTGAAWFARVISWPFAKRRIHRLRPLLDLLQYNGWNFATKPVREFTRADGMRKVKGNTSIELTKTTNVHSFPQHQSRTFRQNTLGNFNTTHEEQRFTILLAVSIRK